MTLTPSVRAISLCSFPCVANLFARASFVAISTLECLFILAMPALPSALPMSLQMLLRVYFKGTYGFPCPVPEGGADSSEIQKVATMEMITALKISLSCVVRIGWNVRPVFAA
jgi:hypothetical protein